MLPHEQQRTIWVALALLLGTLILYARVAGFDFITNLDDSAYVRLNEHVKNGLTWNDFLWSFQAGYASNWHPLTWMSHMLDCQLFGPRPGPAHVVNVLLHAVNSVLLFLAMKRLTDAFWRSAAVGALFAWHPLHVESVAWIAERKDVLSALFWMLALLAYVRYARCGRKRFYGLCLICYALGLMAKPMVITLPFVLLLLDWWPLARLNWKAVLEKGPFLLLAIGAAIMTCIAQSKGGAVVGLEFVPVTARFSNAVVDYIRYLGKLFWPAHLSIFYPLDLKLPPATVLAAVLIVGSISAAIFLGRNKRPYCLAGWLWYLGTLVPVLGVVQVGAQSSADRYMYLPSIGIFIIVCWAMNELPRPTGAILIVCALIACMARTNAQLAWWRDDEQLYRHALALDPNNYTARVWYGDYLRQHDELPQAQAQFERAIKINATYVGAYTALSGVLEAEGKTLDAAEPLRQVIKLRPDFSDARCDLAQLLFENNRNAEAEAELEQGLKLDPGDPQLHLFLGAALARQKKYDPAEAHFAQAIRLAPQEVAAEYQWALALAAQGKTADAIAHYRAVLRLNPNFANALNDLAWILASSPDPHLRNGKEALALASRACALTHGSDPIKLETLADACAECGNFDEAAQWAQKASDVALAHGQKDIAEQNLELKKLFQAHHPFYEY